MKSTTLWKAALFTTLFATTTTSAYAMYIPDQEKNSTPQYTQGPTVMLADYAANGLTHRLVINGKGYAPEQTSIYTSHNQIMVPVRTIADALGFTLTWHKENNTLELTKGNQWFQFKIGADNYNIAKMPVTLGVAPELTNNKTYVPLSFFRDVIKVNVQVDETGTISISDKAEEMMKHGVITSIDKSQIGINGFTHGLNLNITDSTIISTTDGQKLSFKDLKLGMDVDVRTEKWATLSIPPMTNAVQITVKDATMNEMLGTTGEITDVQDIQNGMKQITVKGTKLSEQAQDTIVLVVSNKTSIIGTKDNQPVSIQELKTGQKLHAFYGPIMTRSLPPIGQAAKLMIEN
ncbi:copper amine oxidase N-terminal domain-containing protein [Aneurinibacillus uraniidurans]|uniref:copper amine oxidase N-terminal domain-containing protein n=1 Tax=Aneurinibacillus uraniidurans TaxID=2966586 RepID=UPI002349BD42|nr:copper amine oxidase N-terminal domain-containing protein [Aneurinibacillus sp. B1]WCN37396.1 copper amine oxidase N-terminal domain-containing protein [Aneurinibacillus sp. B1]